MNKPETKRIVYLGSPQFAVPALSGLLAAGYQVPLVITQPDRPKGRRRQLTPTEVRRFAESRGIRVLAVPDVNQPQVVAEVQAARPELMVVAAFGQLLKEPLLAIPPLGVVNIHGSLLPTYRGAAPIQQALIDGCRQTGVTIMYVEKRLDAGAMLAKAACDILPEDDLGSLRERLSLLGADLLLDTLPGIFAGTLRPEPQAEALATYAGKITAEREQLDWQQPASVLHNLVRGLVPDTSAYTCYFDKGQLQRLKIWQTEPVDFAQTATPGEVLGADSRGLLVAAGEGALRLLAVQPSGKQRMEAAAWWRGRRDLQTAGLRFCAEVKPEI